MGKTIELGAPGHDSLVGYGGVNVIVLALYPTNVLIHLIIYIYIRIYIYTYIYIYMCVCIYIYIKVWHPFYGS